MRTSVTTRSHASENPTAFAGKVTQQVRLHSDFILEKHFISSLISQKTNRNPLSDISNQVIERLRPNQKAEKPVEKVTHENGFTKFTQKQVIQQTTTVVEVNTC